MKHRVVFVAGLHAMKGGGHGGQLTEASTLFESGLRKVVEWIPLDSTMESVPPPPLWRRSRAAAGRLLRFAAVLQQADAALIFTSDGLSLFEKGAMCLWARARGRGVVLRFGSGNLPAQCKRHPVLRWWLRGVLRAASVVSVQGPTWAEYFGQFTEAAGKIMSVGNGVRLPTRPPERAFQNRMVFVGWVQKEKGVFEAIEVLERVRRSHPSATLTVAGGGRDEGELKKLVKARGLESCVRLLGWVPQEKIFGLLSEMDVLLFPSHAEGMPNAVLEAMAAALPVVATRVGAVPQLVRDGATGFTAGVGDVEALTRGIEKLFGDERLARELGRRGRAEIEERFDIDRIWPRYEEAIEQSVSGPRECGRRTRLRWAPGDGQDGRPAPARLRDPRGPNEPEA